MYQEMLLVPKTYLQGKGGITSHAPAVNIYQNLGTYLRPPPFQDTGPPPPPPFSPPPPPRQPPSSEVRHLSDTPVNIKNTLEHKLPSELDQWETLMARLNSQLDSFKQNADSNVDVEPFQRGLASLQGQLQELQESMVEAFDAARQQQRLQSEHRGDLVEQIESLYKPKFTKLMVNLEQQINVLDMQNTMINDVFSQLPDTQHISNQAELLSGRFNSIHSSLEQVQSAIESLQAEDQRQTLSNVRADWHKVDPKDRDHLLSRITAHQEQWKAEMKDLLRKLYSEQEARSLSYLSTQNQALHQNLMSSLETYLSKLGTSYSSQNPAGALTPERGREDSTLNEPEEDSDTTAIFVPPQETTSWPATPSTSSDPTPSSESPLASSTMVRNPSAVRRRPFEDASIIKSADKDVNRSSLGGHTQVEVGDATSDQFHTSRPHDSGFQNETIQEVTRMETGARAKKAKQKQGYSSNERDDILIGRGIRKYLKSGKKKPVHV